MVVSSIYSACCSFYATAATEIDADGHTLSLHDALPIYVHSLHPRLASASQAVAERWDRLAVAPDDLIERVRRSGPGTTATDAVKAALRVGAMATARWRPPPDYLIIGAKRGGTTSLHAYLGEHPGVMSLFPRPDRPSVVSGKRVSVRVDLGARRMSKTKKQKT